MALKIKEEYKDQEIYVSFDNANKICKFIDEGLYPHLVKVYPHIFTEVIVLDEVEEAIIDMYEPKKKK